MRNLKKLLVILFFIPFFSCAEKEQKSKPVKNENTVNNPELTLFKEQNRHYLLKAKQAIINNQSGKITLEDIKLSLFSGKQEELQLFSEKGNRFAGSISLNKINGKYTGNFASFQADSIILQETGSGLQGNNLKFNYYKQEIKAEGFTISETSHIKMKKVRAKFFF